MQERARAHSQSPRGQKEEKLKFSRIYDSSATQEDIFSYIQQKGLDRNQCIIAYGQTGSGKTWTMAGGEEPHSQGLMPRLLSVYLKQAEENPECESAEVVVSAFEVYRERVIDLLSEDNCCVKANLFKFEPKSVQVSETKEIREIIGAIKERRKVGDNAVN